MEELTKAPPLSIHRYSGSFWASCGRWISAAFLGRGDEVQIDQRCVFFYQLAPHRVVALGRFVAVCRGKDPLRLLAAENPSDNQGCPCGFPKKALPPERKGQLFPPRSKSSRKYWRSSAFPEAWIPPARRSPAEDGNKLV